MSLISIFGDEQYQNVKDRAIRFGMTVEHEDSGWKINIKSLRINLNELKGINVDLIKLDDHLNKDLSRDKSFIVEPCDKVFGDLDSVIEYLDVIQTDSRYWMILNRPSFLKNISFNKLPNGIFKLFLDFDCTYRPNPSSIMVGYGCSLQYSTKDDKPIDIITYMFDGKHGREDLELDLELMPDMIAKNEYTEFDFYNKNQMTILYIPHTILYEEQLVMGDVRGWER